jgi:predicted short-subunit dehydrogenase-like oxidoreductase (DUF2520 family)
MGKKQSINLCIIGAGRLGTTLGYALSGKKTSGINIKAISSRTDTSLKRAKEFIGEKSAGILFTKNNIEAALTAECVLICTPDDTIKTVCDEVYKRINLKGKKGKGDNNKDKYYTFHFSGSKSLGVLDSARNAGAEIASIHPIKSFASIDEAIKTLPGTVYGLTCSGKNSEIVAKKIVKCLDGEIIKVDDNKKPLYHAAACVASNYMVTLLNYAVMLHKKIGINPQDSLKGLISLSEGTLENIKKMGTEKSLTGPIARGDTGTIIEHMENLKEVLSDEEIIVYKIMGVETAKIAYRNKWIDKKTLEELIRILKG